MARIKQFEIRAVELPFRQAFRTAAKERGSSESFFLKCVTDCGSVGYGESLVRDYVTGETRDGAVDVLHREVLPRLIGKEFQTPADVKTFLEDCDGKAPADWISPDPPQTGAWCAVDLALLDAFGHAFDEPVRIGDESRFPDAVRYSPVISSKPGWALWKTLLKIRLYGFRQVKLKVEQDNYARLGCLTRRILGRRADIRADANMAWTVDEALKAMEELSTYRIRSFEQPIPRVDFDGLARLVRESRLSVMVDESLNDRTSLERLIEQRACTAVNVRIAKCGGLVASYARCCEALDAGLTVQVGSLVGESSLLSAANLTLVTAVQDVTYAEGCFGHLLLAEDPASPCLQFGYGGRAPSRPDGPGFGVTVDEKVLDQCTVRREIVK